jgi:hypothetical protein
MFSFSTRRAGILVIGLVIFLGINRDVRGQEVEYTNYNFAITPPAGWNAVTEMLGQHGIVAAFRDLDRRRVLFVMVDDKHKPTGPVNEIFALAYDQGLKHSSGGEKLSGRFIQVGGIKAYERVGTAVMRGKPVSNLTLVVPADGQYYNVQVMRFDGDVMQDADATNAVASFRFLHPPTPPPQFGGSGAFHAGYIAGMLGMLIFVIAGGIVSVGIIIRSRRESAERSSRMS